MGAIKKGLESATTASAKGLGKVQVGMDRVLWGKNSKVYSAQKQDKNSTKGGNATQATAAAATAANTAGSNPAVDTRAIATPTTGISTSAAFNQANKDATSNANTVKAKGKQLPNPLDLGVFPLLDLLISVDLCNVVTYFLSQVGGKNPKKRSENPNAAEKGLYNIQDTAREVQIAIDKFTSAPDRIIGKYSGMGAQGGTESVSVGSPTDLSGTNTQKFNLATLFVYIRESFSTALTTTEVDGKPLFTPEDQQLMTAVPGLQGNLNILNDFLKTFDKYTDYRNINNVDFQKLLKKINTLRAICITVQGLDVKNPQSVFALLPPGSVQAEAAKIQQVLDPTRILPVLKQINDAVKSFMKMAQQAQAVLAQSQFIVKLGVLFVKIFKLIISFLKKLPIPNLYTTAGVTTTFADILNKLSKISDEIIEILQQVNSLFAVIISFIRYIQTNTQQLLLRIQTLIGNLAICEPLKDSDVIKQLQQTNTDLTTLSQSLQKYLDKYDYKTDPSRANFGKYTIQVVDEEITDTTVTNKRRRGIALDELGTLVTQSDLTFATDLQIIIQEVKYKLIGLNLVQPGLANISAPDLGIITESLSFLEDEDVGAEDLNVTTQQLEDPDTDNDDAGLGLQGFANKLKGGRKLRRKTREKLAQAKVQMQQQVAKEKGVPFKAPATGTSNSGSETTDEEQQRIEKEKKRKALLQRLTGKR